jgi:nucleoside-diphosphate-sugar epimerase
VAAKVLIVGCGDLGLELARQLQIQDLIPIGLRRSFNADASFDCIQADVTESDSLSVVPNLNPDFLVYCVAASAQTDENYRQHYVEGLRNVLNALDGAINLMHVIFVSSTRMYGQTTDALLDENAVPQDMDFGGLRLLEAENLLKQAGKSWTHSALRLTGIYGPGRNRMLNLAANLSNWPIQNTWSNRIHRDDAAAFIVHLIQMVLDGQLVQDCYVVTDSCPVSQYEVLHWIASQMGMDVGTEIPEVIGGKRMSNQRMLSTGFSLKFPDYKAGYSAMLNTA